MNFTITERTLGGTRGYLGYEGISGVRGDIRGTREYPGYDGDVRGMKGLVSGDTRV